MTNHTLSAKIPSVSLREPYLFARDAMLVGRDRAERNSEISPEDWERPLVCAGKDLNLRSPKGDRFTVCCN